MLSASLNKTFLSLSPPLKIVGTNYSAYVSLRLVDKVTHNVLTHMSMVVKNRYQPIEVGNIYVQVCKYQ